MCFSKVLFGIWKEKKDKSWNFSRKPSWKGRKSWKYVDIILVKFYLPSTTAIWMFMPSKVSWNLGKRMSFLSTNYAKTNGSKKVLFSTTKTGCKHWVPWSTSSLAIVKRGLTFCTTVSMRKTISLERCMRKNWKNGFADFCFQPKKYPSKQWWS